MKITFYGATDTVTGSRFLVETDRTKILVDCGLFQGVRALRDRNWEGLPVRPSELDGIALTHAHIDHSGYIPALTRTGVFTGQVHCTEATKALASVLLPDSGYLQEEQAKFMNRMGLSKHAPALPLYTAANGKDALRYFRAAPINEPVQVGDLELRFNRVGHILGASSIHVTDGDRSASFSGDVGRVVDPLLLPPSPLPHADVAVVESTYGGRRHTKVDPKTALGEVVRRTIERGGVLLIPAFAVGRTQMLLHYLAELTNEAAIPRVPIYLDSPMAISATEILLQHPYDHALSKAQCNAIADIAIATRTTDESKAITHRKGPMIIMSASGMATGGRILHHLKARLGDKRNTVMFAGFQAAGTRGEALVNGAEEIKIHGAYHSVDAEVVRIDALSAHADGAELVDWLRQTPRPERAYVVHGEPAERDAMRRLLRDKLGWEAHVPSMGTTITV
ncbi:MAG: MBL fold metallo-hydrolase [Proteobacteria bacterium]|nr:MBL fold metallo-hydrolase [Pseudomonadota bacterium]